jgi:hypothetical protein
MRNKRRLWKEAQALFRAKAERRRKLARLPIERKIGILMELQKIGDDIRAARGETKRRAWNLPGKRGAD